MNFKKIELAGFKSFADRLEIKFESGITGIVGPNGCGKSNVSDAIRWVLGEQSTKMLRGKSMQDVIFNGTEKRKSMSYCEVSLVFDNSSRMFNLNYDEVAFTRKLYRSGESEYLINGTPCRLRDITDALHDSGIGKEGYSIIGQGKVEEIISAKPENRRAIFEEAAGIANFKKHKEEAENKLERTQDNLNRANDVLAEQEKQLGPLKRQAENAKIYLALRDELKTQEVNVYVAEYDSASDTKSQIQIKIDGYTQDISAKQSALDKVNFDYDDKMNAVSKIDKEIQDLNDEILANTVALEKKAGEANINRVRLDFLKNQKDTLEQDRTREALNVENAEKLISENQTIKTQKEVEYKQVCYALEDVSNNYLSVVGELTGAEDEATKKQKEMIDELSKMTDVKSNVSALKAQKDAYLNNITDLDEKIYSLQTRIKDKENELQKFLQLVRTSSGKCESLSKDLTAKNNGYQELKTELYEVSEKLAKATSNMQILQNRKKMLEDMRRDYDGFNYAVKNLMQDANTNKTLKDKIVGIVANSMTIPKGFETAIEVALGGAVQDVITKDDADAKVLIQYLKNNNLGRATFLPVSNMKVRTLSDQELRAVKSVKTYGTASSIIKFDKFLTPVFESLLARTVIVQDLDIATTLAKNAGFTFKIVTLDGDVVNPAGSMTGGSKKANTSNILSRDNEIASIEEELVKLQNSYNNLKENKAFLESKGTTLERESGELSKALVNEQVELAKHKQNHEQLSIFVDELNKERINFSQERIEFTTKIEVISKALDSADKNGVISFGDTTNFEDSQKAFASLRAKRDELQEQMTNLKVQKTSYEGEINAINAENERLSNELLRSKLALQEVSTNLDKVAGDLKSAEAIIGAKIDSVDDDGLKQKISDAKAGLASLDGKKQGYQVEIRHLDEEKSRLMNEMSLVQEKKYQQESALAKVDTDIEAMQEKIFEDYELTYGLCLPLKLENFDVKQGHIEINRIKREINKLGPINVNAIDDCKELLERYEALKAQAEDLTVAKEDLIKIIADLSQEMLSRFNATFEVVQQNFTKTFRELFGGGSARLELTESEDPLKAGVEIIAQPPEKKLQSITLLSGGEKALTAIAILFAILKSRPMPFCLLDEIEAALDDTNVSRFAQYLKNFSKETQFIVITHRKPTMMLADSLYGVTMEERGVSKVVSVKLQDAIKNSTEENKGSAEKSA